MGQVLSFLRFCVFFRVFRSRGLQNRPGKCLNASGVCFASNLHIWKWVKSWEIGKIRTFWDFFNFGSSFASPSGKIHFRKTHPKQKA